MLLYFHSRPYPYTPPARDSAPVPLPYWFFYLLWAMRVVLGLIQAKEQARLLLKPYESCTTQNLSKMFFTLPLRHHHSLQALRRPLTPFTRSPRLPSSRRALPPFQEALLWYKGSWTKLRTFLELRLNSCVCYSTECGCVAVTSYFFCSVQEPFNYINNINALVGNWCTIAIRSNPVCSCCNMRPLLTLSSYEYRH